MTNGSSDRIEESVTSWIAAAPDGARLPSTRALAAEHGAGPVTVQRALRRLVARGLVEARPGVGTFVRRRSTARAGDASWQSAALGPVAARYPESSGTTGEPSAETIALHSGYPAAELLPTTLVRAAVARVARTSHALRPTPAAGAAELRSWFAADLSSLAPAGAPVSARDVLVLPGTQSGLGSIFRTVAGVGRPVVVEAPTYWGAILAAAQTGVVLVPVASGEGGPDPDEVEDALRRTGARLFYAQPTFANPTGVSWSADRRRAVLEAVRRRGAFLVEDDWARDLSADAERPTPPPLATLDDDGHVIYLRSLTKSVAPAVRVGAVVARGPVRERLAADRGAESMYVSGLLQAVALDVVTQPAWRRHVRGLATALGTRRDALLAALAAGVPEGRVDHVPGGGLNLWLRLPDGTDPVALASATAARGVLVAPGHGWFPAEPLAPCLRLSFAGAEPARFVDAAAVLGEELRARRPEAPAY